jgi:hypothetical protein
VWLRGGRDDADERVLVLLHLFVVQFPAETVTRRLLRVLLVLASGVSAEAVWRRLLLNRQRIVSKCCFSSPE